MHIIESEEGYPKWEKNDDKRTKYLATLVYRLFSFLCFISYMKHEESVKIRKKTVMKNSSVSRRTVISITSSPEINQKCIF